MHKLFAMFLFCLRVILCTDGAPCKPTVSWVSTVAADNTSVLKNSTLTKEELNNTLINFFNTSVSPIVDKAVKQTTENVDKSVIQLCNHISSLYTSTLTLLEELKKNTAKVHFDTSAPKSNSGKTPADPFPGYLEDYQFLMGIVTRTARCGGCCTCQKGEMCLFYVFIQLYLIINNNPNWQPPNISSLVNFGGISTTKNSVALEIVLQNLGKKRCTTCILCQEISRDQKLSFMFNTDVISKLFGAGNSADKSMLINLIMSGGMGSRNLDNQLNLLPILMSFVESGKSDRNPTPTSTCPFTGSTGKNGCDKNVTTGPSCPSQALPAQPTCPTVSSATVPPTGSIPTSTTTPASTQPVYGIPLAPSGAPVHHVNPNVTLGSKPAYGVSYGSYV
ncbi:hypothetical protein THOM_3193 [Trachipleistophora hominis]|uniref:Uncharacterized protein n=1 Tax=Trachipleistophora hominis TaxID=72359 RepID=L7JRJ9_TRAHO|nr:hypothetical protein THOM_3193 [Trachipleistophora hominis]